MFGVAAELAVLEDVFELATLIGERRGRLRRGRSGSDGAVRRDRCGLGIQGARGASAGVASLTRCAARHPAGTSSPPERQQRNETREDRS